MPAGHLSRRRRVLRRALFVRRNWWWRGAHSRDAGNAAEEDARDVTGSDNAPPRIACTHTHKRGLPRIQDDGDDAIPSACPRALRFPPHPAAFPNRLPRLNALRYQSFPPRFHQCFPTRDRIVCLFHRISISIIFLSIDAKIVKARIVDDFISTIIKLIV